jgi:hypothetical protein
MFESGSNLIGLHMEKVEFHNPFKIQQTSGLVRLLDSIAYEGIGLAFTQEHQAHYVGGNDC